MDELGRMLKEYRGKRSIRELSRQLGISHTYLDSLEKGYDPRTQRKRKPTPETLKKLSEGLGAPYVELLEVSGYLTKEDDLTKGFCYYLKELRQKTGKTLGQVSEESGLSIEYLTAAENGKEIEPPQKELQKLGETLGIQDFYTWFLENTSYVPYGAADLFGSNEYENKLHKDDLKHLLTSKKKMYFNRTQLSVEDKKYILEVLERSFNKNSN